MPSDARTGFDLSNVNQDDLRVIAALVALLLACIVLTALSFLLDPASPAAVVLLDRQSAAFPYPLTVQNLMHLMFALGVGDVLVRFHAARDAVRQIDKRLLPQAGGLLSDAALGELHERVTLDGAGNNRHIHRLIHRVILQYDATGSVGEAHAVLNSSVEYFQHEIALRYNVLKYLTWLLPTLGFIGTLIGISLALASAGTLPDLSDQEALEEWINALTSGLGVAFYTTLVALALSAVLMLLSNLASGKEERALNDTGQYCLDHLINRLRNRPGQAAGDAS